MNNLKIWKTLAVVSLFVLSAVSLQAQGEFSVAQTQFQLEMAELEAKVEGGLRKLVTGYKKALTTLQKKYMAAGKLDETLVLRNEIARVQSDTSIPDMSVPGIPADMLRYMKAYESNYNKLMAMRDGRSAGIVKAYIKKMDDLKVSLTRAGDITGATRAKDEVEQIVLAYSAILNPTPPERGSSRPENVRSGPAPASPGLAAFKARFPHLNGALKTYYSFDSGVSATGVKDETVNAIHAQTKGVAYGEGHSGQGAELDSDDTINLGQSSPLHKMEVGSFSFWVKTTSTSGVMLSSYMRSSSRGFRVDIGREGHVRFSLGGYNSALYGSYTGSYNRQNTRRTDRAESDQAINDGNWHHVVAVKDSKKIYVYVDGDKGASSYSERALMDATGDLRINGYRYADYADEDASYNYYEGMDGVFDDFMIFNRPLNEQEVKSIYSLQR